MIYRGIHAVTNLDVPVTVCTVLPPELNRKLLVKMKRFKITKAELIRRAVAAYFEHEESND